MRYPPINSTVELSHTLTPPLWQIDGKKQEDQNENLHLIETLPTPKEQQPALPPTSEDHHANPKMSHSVKITDEQC